MKLPIGFLNPLLKVFASEISGFASGNLKLSGEAGNLVLQGAVKAENASMKINYLQTKYSMNDSVRFDKDGIKFNNVRLTDVEGDIATLSGSVNHKNFRNYSADLIINITSTGFLVLNTQAKDNPMFYGTAYASGVAKIKSDQNSLSFDISAKTANRPKQEKPRNFLFLSAKVFLFRNIRISHLLTQARVKHESWYLVPPLLQNR